MKTRTSTKGIRKGRSPDRKPRSPKRFHYRKSRSPKRYHSRSRQSKRHHSRSRSPKRHHSRSRSPKRHHSRSRQSKRHHSRSRSREHKRMHKHRSTSYRQEGSSSTQVPADESCLHIPVTQSKLPKSKEQSSVSSFTSTGNTTGRKSRSRSRENK